ncbi:MAG: SpoIIE family protein phosphatase [Spirochaetales bacterium]|nr:SpoIIE family protein phosphatase [Spirochaetales bacterium]
MPVTAGLLLCSSFLFWSCEKPALPQLEYSSHSRTIADIRNETDWREVGDIRRPRFGYRFSSVWLRSEIGNPADVPLEGVMTAGPAQADEIQAIVFTGPDVETFTGGDRISFTERPIAYRTLAFPYTIPPRSTATFYFQYHFSGFNTVSISSHSLNDFENLVRKEYFFYGVYFSIFAALILLQTGLLFFNRSVFSAYYALYLCGAGLVLLIQNGLAQQFFYPAGGFLLNDGLRILALFTVTMATLFSRSFFTMSREHGLFHRLQGLMRGLSLTMILLIPLFGLFEIPGRSFLLNSIVILASLFIVWIAVLALKERKFQAHIFVASWSVFALSLVWRFLDQLGFLPPSDLALHALEIGVMGEALIFSYALVVRTRQATRGRLRARSRLSRIQSEIAEASNIHRRILPAEVPSMPGVRICVRYRPLLEIGGDLYGFHQVSRDRSLVFLADVSGHGLGAALDASLVWAAFRNATQGCTDPGEILTRMNAFLSSQWEDRYATAICALLDCSKQTAVLATAGHPLPVVLPQQSEMRLSGTMLGLEADFKYPVLTLDLTRSERILFFTDGLTESRARSRESGEMELYRLALQAGMQGESLVDELLVRMEEWRADPSPMDDITLLMLEFQ